MAMNDRRKLRRVHTEDDAYDDNGQLKGRVPCGGDCKEPVSVRTYFRHQRNGCHGRTVSYAARSRDQRHVPDQDAGYEHDDAAVSNLLCE